MLPYATLAVPRPSVFTNPLTRNKFSPQLLLLLLTVLLLSASLSRSLAAQGDEHWGDRLAWAVMEGSRVRAVASSGSNVYFGGQFLTVGGTSAVAAGTPATNIAVWNGRSWAAV
jgi:hypothetical protein